MQVLSFTWFLVMMFMRFIVCDNYMVPEVYNSNVLEGKHNGLYRGVQYFSCSKNRGIFTETHKLVKVCRPRRLVWSFWQFSVNNL